MDAKRRQEIEGDFQAILKEELASIQAQALALARAQAADLVAVTTELDALHALLADAPELLELAAEMARAAGMVQCSRCPARDRCPAFDNPDPEQWPCYQTPAQLRELARALREAGVGGEEKEEEG